MPDDALETMQKLYLAGVENNTPQRVKDNPIINLTDDSELAFKITKENLYRNSDNPKHTKDNFPKSNDGLDLYDWLENYRREANTSTAGIRGPQNPLYPWDTRYPINMVGMFFATLSKALVSKEVYKNKKLVKLCAREVRYNSQKYVEMISRIQAALGIRTIVAPEDRTLPVWLASFLIFMLDLSGGEYITSSHAISKKIATKDLNSQGGQYVPKESLRFVSKIEQLFKQIEELGYSQYSLSAKKDPLIDREYLKSIDYGIPMYVEYLRNSVATEHNISLIKSAKRKIVLDVMHGSMYKTMSEILGTLQISDSFDFLHAKEDPFFGGIGKYYGKDGNIVDRGVDTTIYEYAPDLGRLVLPVAETLDYAEILKSYPTHTVSLMTDPDGDRLVTSEVVGETHKSDLDKAGIPYTDIGGGRLLALYMPNQSFLMTLDFRAKLLKASGLWEQYDWFIIKTSPSAQTWNEWAEFNNVKIIYTPVGFKELALVMQKIEQQLKTGTEPVIKDIFGFETSLGKNPRLLFAGEESGGEIFGPTELIKSTSGRTAISMREKSAGEAIIITSAISAQMEKEGKYFYEYLTEIFDTNQIYKRFDIRVDHRYYNENEPDIYKMEKEKEIGLAHKESNERYFLGLCLSVKDGTVNLLTAKNILKQDIPELDWNELLSIDFVGDGTFFTFTDMCVEIRPSGTDAINKAYGLGNDKALCRKYAELLAGYKGDRGSLYKSSISDAFYRNSKSLALQLLEQYHSLDFTPEEYNPDDCAIR